jgi:hypothetical protein
MNKFWTHLNIAALATVLFCFASCQNNQNFSLKAHQAAKTAEATQASLADEEMDQLVAKRDDGHHKKKKEKKKKRRKSKERKSR